MGTKNEVKATDYRTDKLTLLTSGILPLPEVVITALDLEHDFGSTFCQTQSLNLIVLNQVAFKPVARILES